jgi:hypothetical protein
MKKSWVQHTRVWTADENEWFKKKIDIGYKGYCWIGFLSFLLVSTPAALGFIVSFFTPRVCLSCRSLTFLVYAACQTVLIIVATWRSYFYQHLGPDVNNILTEIRRSFNRITGNLDVWSIVGAGWFLVTVVVTLAAIGGSIFTGFAGTLMQIIGVYRNCKCYIPASTWQYNPGAELINMATDTQEMRNSSKYWEGTGIGAISFLAVVCYMGWWYQRYLRRRFEERVTELGRVQRGGQLSEAA